MSKFGYGLILILLLLGSIGCSGPKGTTTDGEPPLPPPVDWSEHEDFDPATYPEPPEDPSIIHDVPDELISLDSASPTPRRRQAGFRIQILATPDKREADQAVEDVLAWWRDFEERSIFDEIYEQTEVEPPIYQDFRDPNYRVRIGNFISQDNARRFLEVIKRKYDRAFVAPGMVSAE